MKFIYIFAIAATLAYLIMFTQFGGYIVIGIIVITFMMFLWVMKMIHDRV